MESLEFVVMLDGVPEKAELVDFLASLPDWNQKAREVFEANGNHIELSANDRADEVLATESESGYLHYQWSIESTPLSSVTEEQQVEFARALTAELSRMRAGVRVEVLANFEDLI
ncbi:hypothetical protein GCM10022247_54850 [Allokutzneria multivorans]|uniref:Uncharacterized protein n=1 Tax=Allokutzneria multivorans TaxID=1142134 RepID=A0ABP7TAP4_9PSEU